MGYCKKLSGVRRVSCWSKAWGGKEESIGPGKRGEDWNTLSNKNKRRRPNCLPTFSRIHRQTGAVSPQKNPIVYYY